ncbi:COX assembly mitochondrial protein [Chloropicon primus]|uniref:COX assembly mitochondrial protein n=2 Tax=Chloropicon primus TaxID=1764295 RepID=A0A5B8MVS5_9CHLO|nr:hypothetical protein A3770_13p70350 [Chloropicon primus]UPR03726.1 COX assembly mitochondrial protein [Chloropicon primus]|eukprot:QDZ24517.1 hypothetical protein A3770_13p70350 [Chloropicon primus]
MGGTGSKEASVPGGEEVSKGPDPALAHESHQAKTLRYSVKKKAMAACGELHGDLLDCFQKASMFTFKPICQEENNAFWECYKRERGMSTTETAAQRDMSFRQMYDDTAAYVQEQWSKGSDPKD